MTYLVFHVVFILPPILVLAWVQRGRLRSVHPHAGLLLGLLAAIALVYTTPWDNYLVWRGVWSYGTDRILGTIGYVPLEEYLFFILQPVLGGLWLYLLHHTETTSTGGVAHWIGAAVYCTLALFGLFLLRRPDGTYLGLILVWAAPILALQWAYAGREIWARRRLWAAGVAIPTVYLCAADAVAIHEGIWRISEEHTLGPVLGPLPLEEAIFFLATNLLVIQGLLLFLHAPRPAAAENRVATRSDAPDSSDPLASIQNRRVVDGSE